MKSFFFSLDELKLHTYWFLQLSKWKIHNIEICYWIKQRGGTKKLLALSEFKVAYEAAKEIGAKVIPGNSPLKVCIAHTFMYAHTQNSRQHTHTQPRKHTSKTQG